MNTPPDMKDTLDILPMLTDKFTVDFANSIDVTNDHIRTQKQQTGFAARFMGALTGTSAKRQTEINISLATGVEASLKWLTELSESLAQSNYAIICVSNRLETLTQSVAQVANYSADTREQLKQVSAHFAERCHIMEDKITYLMMQDSLDQVFTKWQAGRYNDLPYAGRCYAALEELRWGEFGDYQRSHIDSTAKQKSIDNLRNRVIAQLRSDTQREPLQRCDTRDWLIASKQTRSDHLHDAMAYLGDAANDVQHPFIYSATQQPQQLPLRMPRISSIERLSDAMLGEVFQGVA